MAQLIRITSEALQATIRRLLPSQQGFGEDLQATNVITPIIDLTPSAEGSEVRQDLQTASAFGSSTEIDITGAATTTVINTPGFFRVIGCFTQNGLNTTQQQTVWQVNDGSTTKILWGMQFITGPTEMVISNPFDITVFLRTGDSLEASTTDRSFVRGSFRQIADVNGDLVNPVGFTPQ